jgi:hypothetical protein
VLPAAQGHSSLERKYGYDTYRNEAYGFVDVIIDFGREPDFDRTGLITVIAAIVRAEQGAG